MKRNVGLALVLTLAVFAAVACKGKPDRGPAPPPAATAPAPASGGSGGGPEPISAHGSGQPAPLGAADRASAGLVYTLPAGWNETPVSSSMRLAQGEISGPGGAAEFAVYFFGPGQGGGPEANLERWAGQVEATVPEQQETFETNGLKVTWIDVAGTLKPVGMGMGPSSPQPGGRLFGAVIEGPDGPWFFKVLGPDATLGAEREKFVGMLKAVRLRG